MRDRLARLVKRGPKAGDPQPNRLPHPHNPGTPSRTPSQTPSRTLTPPLHGEQSLRARDARSAAGVSPSPICSSNGDGTPGPGVQEADNSDNMWVKADKQLREDQQMRERLEQYDSILIAHLGYSFGSRSTTDTQLILNFLKAGANGLQENADTILQRYTDKAERCLKSVLNCVLKFESLITTAAQSCPPASLACAGVMVLFRLCLDAIDQRHVLFEGLTTVAGAIRRLAEYEQLLWKQRRPRLEEVEASMIAACTYIIEFQARAALYLQRNPVESAIRNAIKKDGWDKLLSSIKEVEGNVRECAARKGLREVEGIFDTIQDTRHSVDEGFAKQDKTQESSARDKKVQSFLRLLLEKGCVSEAIKNRNRRRVRDTCNWFTDHELFKAWKFSTADKAPGLLYVTADPGCGKSVLSRYLIEEVLPDDGRLVCYFFFKDDFVEQKSARSAICTLLHQMFVTDPCSLTDDILAKFRAYDTAFAESLDLLWDTFLIAAARRNMIVVLDGLDECREDDRKQLITRITGLYQPGGTKAMPGSGLKFLLTSRPHEYISRRFAVSSGTNLSSIHLQGDKGETSDEIAKEIEKVVDIRIADAVIMFRLTKPERDLMTEKLRAIPNRTYLWITLLFDGLMDRKSALSKRDILDLTRKPPQGVDEAYEAILSRSTDKLWAKKILHVVLAAEEPLTISQMAVALAFEGLNQSREDVIDNMIPDDRIRETIKDYCGLFIIFVDDKVYLLHQTAREFLLRPKPDRSASMAGQFQFYLSCLLRYLLQLLFMPPWKHSTTITAAHGALTEICISSLYLDLSKTHGSLLQYSASHWADHYRNSDVRCQMTCAPLAWDLCMLSEAEKSWTNSVAALGRIPKKGPAPCIASALGLETVIAHALSNQRATIKGSVTKINLEDKDELGRTPLLWAARMGHEAVVRQLLETGKVEADLKDKDGRTPLSWAARMGHEAVVSQLLKMGKVEAISKDIDELGRTPLSWAARMGHEAVVRQLLETGNVEGDSKDRSGRTPLSWAAGMGREAVVGQLLETDEVEADSKDNDGRTPLSWAARMGHEAVVKQLLKTGKVEADSKDKDGRTPLSLATERKREAVIKLLHHQTTRVKA